MRSIALASLLVAAPALARAAGDDGVLTTIPFESPTGHVSIGVAVDDSDPFRVVLDTGMPTPGILLYRSSVVDALDLPFDGAEFQVGGAGGAGEVVHARVAAPLDLTVGDVVVHDSRAFVMPRPRGFSAEEDGLIGAELFERFVVRVDPTRHELQLIDPKRYEPPADAVVVPVTRENGHAFVATRITIDERETVDATLVIDLGANHAMWLTGAEDGPLAPPAHAIETSLGRGLSGEILGKVGRVRRFEIGSFRFDDVIASFPRKEHQRPGGVDFKDGNLGFVLLTRFDVTFDWPHGRLVLKDAGKLAEPFEHAMLGVVSDAHDGEHAGERVRRVVAGSPAEEAGIVAGDMLLRFDGKDVTEFDAEETRILLTRDGATVLVRWSHDGVEFEKPIRLRRLV